MKLLRTFIVALALIAGLSGCAQPPHSANIDELQISKVTIGPSAKHFIKLNDVRSGLLPGNMMRARVAATNTSVLNKEIIYQFVWFDESGFELPGIVSKWHRLRLTPKQDFNIQSVATNIKATDYKVVINKFIKNN
ncbi:MAG: YcfL family protein [Desulfotalea sp.]